MELLRLRSLARPPLSPFPTRSQSPSDDILRVVVTARSETEKGSKIALDLHAQKAGECAFVIRSGRDSTSVRVRVVR